MREWPLRWRLFLEFVVIANRLEDRAHAALPDFADDSVGSDHATGPILGLHFGDGKRFDNFDDCILDALLAMAVVAKQAFDFGSQRRVVRRFTIQKGLARRGRKIGGFTKKVLYAFPGLSVHPSSLPFLVLEDVGPLAEQLATLNLRADLTTLPLICP